MEYDSAGSGHHSAIERLAYALWEQRGKPLGSPEVDWFLAEAYLPQPLGPNILVCGIDDFATEKQLTSGWTYFVVPATALPDFCRRSAELLPNHHSEFHAKAFKPSQAVAFERFLRLIRDTIDQQEHSVVRVSSSSAPWAKALSEFANRVIANGFAGAGITDPAIIAASQKCAPAVFTLQRALSNFGNNIELRLEIDEDIKTASFNALKTTIEGCDLTAARIFAVALDAYASKQFSNCPRLNRDGSGIRILPSEKSFLVQASDVVGNFATAFAFADIGPTSRGRERKAQIFQDVFGDALPTAGPKHYLDPAGKEITPALDGEVVFQYGH